MKKIFLGLFVVLLMTNLSAQTKKNPIEVLYFKANLACCKARACNALEDNIVKIIEKNYPKRNVVLKEIKLSDTLNTALIEKYKAKSQTIVIVKKSKKAESSNDISDLVKTNIQNYDNLEKEIVAKLNEFFNK
jgi:hypothetical protein